MSTGVDRPLPESVGDLLSRCWVDSTGAMLRFTYADQVTPEPERNTMGGMVMDPNQALEDAREAMARLDASTEQADMIAAALDVTEVFRSLDEWISNGGFLPSAWVES